MDDSPNLPNFPAIRYTAKAVGIKIKLGNKTNKILDHLLALSLMITELSSLYYNIFRGII